MMTLDLPPIAQPDFEAEIGFATSYDALLRGDLEATRSVTDLFHLAMSGTGRLLLSAPAAAGKTQTLARLHKIAESKGIQAQFLALDSISYDDYERANDSDSVVRLLLNSVLCEGETTELLFPADLRRLLLFDGLNEIRPAAAGRALRAADEIAARYPKTAIVICDRLTRRSIRGSRWQLATVRPVGESRGRRILDSAGLRDLPWSDTLGIPLFLDRAISDRELHGDTDGEALGILVARAGLSPHELTSLTATAFSAYRQFRSPVFSRPFLEAGIGVDAGLRLEAAGLLRSSATKLQFSHQLYHDYLVARHLLTLTEWPYEVLDVATLGGSSFDVIKLCSQMMSDRADDLAFAVYDWNYRAAAAVLGQNASTEMNLALLSMLVEKRWDLILDTAQSARDTLSDPMLVRRVADVPEADRIRSCTSYTELFDVLGGYRSTVSWFVEWRDLFSTGADHIGNALDVEGLTSESSLLGWTSANVLRRVQMTPDAVAHTRRLTVEPNRIVRWRAVHVLGAKPDAANGQLLLGRLDDDDQHVRGGVARALVEVIAEAKFRDAVRLRDGLVAFFRQQGVDPAVADKLGHVLVLNRPANSWPSVVGPIVQLLWGLARTADEQESWEAVALAIDGSPAS